MKLTNEERELIERALDEMALAIPPDAIRERMTYERAIRIVRERAGRRVRSDFNQRRVPKAQAEMPV